MMGLTSRCTNSSSVSRIGDNEKGLNEGSQRVDNISEHLSGVLFHVI